MTNLVDQARSILHTLIPEPSDRAFLRAQLHRVAVRLIDHPPTAPLDSHRKSAMAQRLRILLDDRPADLPPPAVPEVLLCPAGTSVLLPDAGRVTVERHAEQGTVVVRIAGVAAGDVVVHLDRQIWPPAAAE